MFGAQTHARKGRMGGQCMMGSISSKKDLQDSNHNISQFSQEGLRQGLHVILTTTKNKKNSIVAPTKAKTKKKRKTCSKYDDKYV